MAKKARTPKRGELALLNARETRRLTFDGLPIVDATANLSLLVKTADIKAAKGNEKDPTNCILAKACAKQLGASTAAFFRKVAYIELPDAKGNKRVVRYELDDDAAAIVRAFDTGKSVKGEVLVTLKAPRPSQRLDALREKERRLQKRRREAKLRGEIIQPNPSQARYAKRASVHDLDVRSGTGMVQHVLKKP